MKVAIVGATGFIGSYLVDAIVAAGMQPLALVRPGSETRLTHADQCKVISGSVEDDAAILDLVKDADAVIYNIGILREFPARGITFARLQQQGAQQVINAAVDAGVKRFLLMSANGIELSSTPYQRTKLAAEKSLQESGLDYAIFRPSVVFGNPRGRMEFATQLCRDIIESPMPAPLFYDGILPKRAGRFELSPVHVQDVADAFLRQLQTDTPANRIFHLGGPGALSWQQILKTIAAAVGKKKLMLPAPVIGVKLAATLLDRFEDFPVTRDQLTMLMQGNVASPDDLLAMGITPRPFDVEQLEYLALAE
jgi:NADH dehydrogenase